MSAEKGQPGVTRMHTALTDQGPTIADANLAIEEMASAVRVYHYGHHHHGDTTQIQKPKLSMSPIKLEEHSVDN